LLHDYARLPIMIASKRSREHALLSVWLLFLLALVLIVSGFLLFR
jgi:hypothetical protein